MNKEALYGAIARAAKSLSGTAGRAANKMPAGSLREKALVQAGKGAKTVSKHPRETAAGMGGAGLGYLAAPSGKKEAAEESVKEKAQEIKSDKKQVQDVMKETPKEKRDDVLKELREEKKEGMGTDLSMRTGMPTTIGMKPTIGQGF